MTVPRRMFGKTRQEVSILGFGLMRLPWTGESHVNIDVPKAEELLVKAVEAGVNYVDTAWPYHGPNGTLEKGSSEPFLGRALAKYGLREKVKIATKLPTMRVDSRASMDAFLNEQLRRLQTDSVDFYMLHGLHAKGWERMQLYGAAEFLDSAKKDGRIGRAGFSFHDEFGLFEKIVGSYDWDFAQIQYNYLDRNFQAGEAGLRLAHRAGLGLAVMEPLRGGALVRDLPREAEEILRRARPEWTLAEWALRWLWNQPEISVALSGMNSLDDLEENLRIASSGCRMTADDLEAVSRVEVFFEERVKIKCTGCGYCLPCPHGVNIPRAFMFFNRYHLLDSHGPRRQIWYFHRSQVPQEHAASNCVGCRECEERCPQKLPVADFMAEAAALFCGEPHA